MQKDSISTKSIISGLAFLMTRQATRDEKEKYLDHSDSYRNYASQPEAGRHQIIKPSMRD